MSWHIENSPNSRLLLLATYHARVKADQQLESPSCYRQFPGQSTIISTLSNLYKNIITGVFGSILSGRETPGEICIDLGMFRMVGITTALI